jgi:hypothetical protein
MDLEELKLIWANYDRKLDTCIRLSSQLLNAATLKKTHSAVQRWIAFVVFELVVNLLGVVLLGSFIADEIASPRFWIPALVLDLFLVSLVAATIRLLAMASAIDFGAAVAEIQRKIETLRIWRIQTTKWTLLLAPLMWIPLLIVVLKGCLGVDAYAVLDGAWLLWNVIFGVAVIPAAIVLSKRYAGRLGRSSAIQRFMRDIAGYNLSSATRFLAELQTFQDESPVA